MSTEIEPLTPEEKIEIGLMAVAMNNGNGNAAAKELKAGGIEIAARTLYHWSRKSQLDRYRQIRAEVLPELRARAADRHTRVAETISKANEKLIKRLSKTADEIPARDLPGAVRNLSTAVAVETDKAQLLNDQPTARTAIDLPGVLAELRSMGVDTRQIIEGSAEDVTDAQVIEEGPEP